MSAFATLAEPSRRLLLDALLDGAKPVNSLVEIIGMSQPVVSKHLRILREAGLVNVKPDGQRRVYSVNPEPLAELDAWLEPYRKFWSEKLDALERHLLET
ncbi:MAG: metalloregulator ArsR/SmtB family transcription factor [Gammaproteobacteria bacterium]|nr:metalloregulator ArsR/SmtB family transcription factor [Gammaproteobacteria bacterium]